MTVYPSPYDRNCAPVTLSQSNIAEFSLDVKVATGPTLSDKTFSVTNTAVGGCTDTKTFVFEFKDSFGNYVSNPYGAYFSLAGTTGVLTYTTPPESFMNGLTQRILSYRLTATLDNYPNK